MNTYHQDGFYVAKRSINSDLILDVQHDLIRLGSLLEPDIKMHDVDDIWNFLKNKNREKGGTLYNGFKHLPSVYKIAVSEQINTLLCDVCEFRFPALIDINCRIDSYGEDKFLFDWHQDYWFSVCSRNSVVVWIPVTDLRPELGGLDIINNKYTNGKIFKTKPGEGYNTYADAVLLDEDIPDHKKISIDDLDIGDCLLFSFKTLHRSKRVLSKNRSRFTIQLRVADFVDNEYKMNKFKPGVVNLFKVDYLEGKIK